MSSGFYNRMRKTRSIIILSKKIIMIDYKKQRTIELSTMVDNHDLFNILPETDHNECFLLWRRFQKYEDYSLPDVVYEKDLNNNLLKHSAGKQPSLTRNFKNNLDNNIRLPIPLMVDEGMFSKISSILYLSLGVVEARSFHKDKVFIKPVPSIGSRHGIEAYLYFNKKKYYYNCEKHILEYLCDTNCSALKIDLCFRPEIYMWRYENGACLFDIYLDLGHVLANIKIAIMLYNSKFSIIYESIKNDDLIKNVYLCSIFLAVD